MSMGLELGDENWGWGGGFIGWEDWQGTTFCGLRSDIHGLENLMCATFSSSHGLLIGLLQSRLPSWLGLLAFYGP